MDHKLNTNVKLLVKGKTTEYINIKTCLALISAPRAQMKCVDQSRTQ